MRQAYLLLLLTLILGVSLCANCAARHAVADLAITADGTIYMLDAFNDEVLKVDMEGNLAWCKTLINESVPDNGTTTFRTGSYRFLLSDGGKGTPQHLSVLSSLMGIREVTPDGLFNNIAPGFVGLAAVDDNCRLYHPNRDKNRIERYTQGAAKAVDLADPGLRFPSGQSVPCDLLIDGSAAGPAHFGHPNNVFVNPTGDRIWVIDQSYSFKVFDGEGKYLYTVKAPDKLNRAFTRTSLKFDDAGNAYISSAEKRCIYKYNSSGKLDATVPAGDYLDTFGLDRSGRLYVTHQDDNGQHISILDQSGKQVGSFPVPK